MQGKDDQNDAMAQSDIDEKMAKLKISSNSNEE